MLRESLPTLLLQMKSQIPTFKQQLECFKGIIAGLQEVPELVHASNSATTLWHAETIFSAVRMGDSMYGLNPSGQVLELPYKTKTSLNLGVSHRSCQKSSSWSLYGLRSDLSGRQ